MFPAMQEIPYQPRRSLIFTDGMKPEMFAKALTSGADMVCVDLEDAIAPEHKNQARDRTLPLFADSEASGAVERMVRINGLRTAEGLADLLAIIASPTPPPSLMLPKIKSPAPARAWQACCSAPMTWRPICVSSRRGIRFFTPAPGWFTPPRARGST